MQRLAGKVAIVTGGGGGIGSATALRLAREGAKVVCADINLETAQRAADALEGNGLALRFDAADADSIEAMVTQTVEHFGRLDILHNNTAITDPQTHGQDLSLLEIPMEVWRKTLDVNLTGYMLACRFAIPHMIEAGGRVDHQHRLRLRHQGRPGANRLRHQQGCDHQYDAPHRDAIRSPRRAL
ncbi:SDR family NAD(P)-dependent oxidoreductase [Pseudomonas sp. NPDC077382]